MDLENASLKVDPIDAIRPYTYLIGTFLWTAAAGLALFQALKKYSLYQKMPPGPYGLPFIGSILHLMRVDPLEEFQKYKKKYGNIFSVSCGDFNLIVVHGYKTIQELSKREEFCGRPDFEVWYLRNLGIKNRGVLLCDAGPVWQEQRRFALKCLRDFGFGKSSMEGMIVYEMQELVRRLKIDAGRPVCLTGAFNGSVLNSLWSIITGKRYEFDDPLFKEAITLLIENFQAVILTYPGLFYPWPAKYNVISRGAWTRNNYIRAKLRNLILEHVASHKATYQESVTRDFIDAYMHEMKNSEEGSSFHGEEGELNLRCVMLDLFVAGAETTSTTLLWSILFLTQNLQVQEKVYDEIVAVIGDRCVCKDDKSNMVYLEAFLNEVYRMSSIIPMSVYHKMLADTEFQGHFFPKNAVIFLNIHDAHHDPEAWGGDAHLFRPERFLDASGTKLVKNEALMPFGAGKRQCLGEALARDTLFIFLVGLLQYFKFEIDPSTANEVSIKGMPTFVSSPRPYKVIMSVRN